MKKLIFCTLFLLFFVSCGSTNYDAFAGIAGQVIDAGTLDPISGAKVSLNPTGKTLSTGSNGYFEFQGLEVSARNPKYRVTVQKDGYTQNGADITVVAGETENITIELERKGK